MLLRIHATEAMRAAENPLPWFDDIARAFFRKVGTGQPGVELDGNGEPTGWLLMNHRGIDQWDLFMLDLWRAGWGYVDALPDIEGGELVALQAARDWANFEQLKERIAAGELTKAEALELAKAELVRQAATLGVDPPSDEPVDP